MKRKILDTSKYRYLAYADDGNGNMRYEIRERRGDVPDASDPLVFWTDHSTVAALHWDNIRDMPIRKDWKYWRGW